MPTLFSEMISSRQMHFFDDYLALSDDISQLGDSVPDIITDGFLAVLILQGHATFSINGNEGRVDAGQLFICKPQIILTDAVISLDLQVRAFFISTSYLERYLMENHFNWNLRLLIEEKRIFTLTKKTQEVICLYYDLFVRRPAVGVAPLFHAFVSEISTILSQKSLQETSTIDNSCALQHFTRFNILLENASQKNHPVRYWANALHITPKYLSAICKNITGCTAREIIKNAVMQDANKLLRNSTLSIKQIADNLGFADQSHFGAFYRRHTGNSPQTARTIKRKEASAPKKSNPL